MPYMYDSLTKCYKTYSLDYLWKKLKWKKIAEIPKSFFIIESKSIERGYIIFQEDCSHPALHIIRKYDKVDGVVEFIENHNIRVTRGNNLDLAKELAYTL